METIEKRNVLALKGKYCKDCIIYTEDVEEEAVNTVGYLLGNPLFRDSKIRVMPDVHQGKGIVIGFTCPVTSFVNPQHVGLDIGCGIDLELFHTDRTFNIGALGVIVILVILYVSLW